MELIKDHAPRNSTLSLIQPHLYYENEFAEASDNGSPGLNYKMEENQAKMLVEEGSSSEKSAGLAKNLAVTSPSSLSSPSSTNSDGLGNQALKFQPQEGHSLINFNAGFGNFHNAAGSLFSFERSESSFARIISNQDDYSVWEDNLQYNYQNQLNSRCCSSTPNPRILENCNNIQTSSNYASTISTGIPFGWLSTEANPDTTINNSIQDLARQEPCTSNKRSFKGESTQSFKKQCNVAKTLKSKSTASASKDPQSVAAKNRRERISERLKTLQDLVPNGSKFDLVTMLEKAISYVKFLQLQVKVLATDEFWPAQGAKAPDLSQVKEAIDAILASQRDRNSSSSKS